MNWGEARDRTLEQWRGLQGSFEDRDEVELLAEINAICELCEVAKEKAAGRWGRCDYCAAQRQFGGCAGISLQMSERVVERDWDGLRQLIGQFVANLETMKTDSEGQDPTVESRP